MHLDVIITGNTFGAFSTLFLFNKNFEITIGHIIPEISIIKDIKMIVAYNTYKNLSIPFKNIPDPSYKEINLILINQEKLIKSEKRFLFSTTLDKLRKFLYNPNSKKIKTFQSSIKELFFNNDKIFLKLSNNKILSCYYLIVADDFWGNTWSFLNFKPTHTGGWIMKIPTTSVFSSEPFIALGYSQKGVILSDSQNIIFAKHIQKEYTIEDLIHNFLLCNKIVKKIVIKEWNKYVLPFSTKEYTFPQEIINKRIFFVTEYLGLMNCFLPEYTYLTSFLSQELASNLDTKIKTLQDFIPTINQAIEYNKTFMKINNFINSFPLIFFKNDEKDKILVDWLLGNINPTIMDKNFREIFENYDRNFKVILSDQAMNSE